MTRITTEITSLLHDKLVKISHQTGRKLSYLYADCVEKGADRIEKDIAQSEDHDFIIAVANAIIKKSDQSEESQQDLYFDFNYKGWTVLIDSKVEYFYSVVEGGDTAPASKFLSLFYNGEFYVSDSDGNEVKRFDHITDREIKETLKNILG